MMFHLQTVASIVALAALLAGCGDDCFDIGCTGTPEHPALYIQVTRANNSFPRDLRGTLELIDEDGTTRVVRFDCGQRYTEGVECRGGGLVVDTPGASVRELRFALETPDGASVAGVTGVRFGDDEPNRCGRCLEARLALTLE